MSIGLFAVTVSEPYRPTILHANSDDHSDPATYSERMFSWFPLLFPFRQPVAVQVCIHCISKPRHLLLPSSDLMYYSVQAGAIIEVCMWRCVRDTKVRHCAPSVL